MKLELRTEPLRKVRLMNKVPGVMFGKSIESTSVQVDEKELKEALKTYGKSMTFKVKLDGKTHHVYIQNVETTILKPHEIIHFDLRRVSETERMTALIHIELVGKEVFFDSDLYIHEAINEVHAEYLPGHGISKIEIDVSKLQLGDVIRVKDLSIPSDVILKADPEQLVLDIREVKLVPEETEDEEEGIDIASDDEDAGDAE
ncbi:MAG: 50S ribosomal protein L25 [Acholeplasmataceae bacterium]|nr:50S ribosomal protein L25 [Acholeplasmataceae bacterium]